MTPDDAPPYRILRRVPGYALGHPLRPDDRVLCRPDPGVAAPAARPDPATNLRPGDAAFVRRSGGAWTYARCEGPAAGGGGGDGNGRDLSFALDDEGHFKVVPGRLLATRVQVRPLVLRVGCVRVGGEAETRTPHFAAHAADGLRTFSDGVRKLPVWRAHRMHASF